MGSVVLAIALVSRFVGRYCFRRAAKKAKVLAWIVAIAATLALSGSLAPGHRPWRNVEIPQPAHRSSEELAAGALLLKAQGVEAYRRALQRRQGARRRSQGKAALTDLSCIDR